MFLYIHLMVITNQKSIIGTHTKKRKESKRNTEVSHQVTREESKIRRKEPKRNTKITRKQ